MTGGTRESGIDNSTVNPRAKTELTLDQNLQDPVQSGSKKHSEPVREGRHLSIYLLKLYVTGANPRTERAIANLQQICDAELEGRYSLEIIDVLEDPEAAERDRVLATPTLIKELPPPLRRIIGDLSDRAKVLLALEIRAIDRAFTRAATLPPSPPT